MRSLNLPSGFVLDKRLSVTVRPRLKMAYLVLRSLCGSERLLTKFLKSFNERSFQGYDITAISKFPYKSQLDQAADTLD